jgi:trans-aconitate methyltransferase
MYTAPDFLQLSHQTRAERFPRIFDTVRQLKPDARRILSFGCSTGEECMSLAERFPAAEVVGVEIDQYTVRTARANNRHPGRVFFLDQVGGTGQYDLCTCLMVLFSLESPIPRERWEATIREIDAHLNPGAVLALYTSEYPFSDSPIASCYESIRAWKRVHDRNQRQYHCGYFRKHQPEPAHSGRRWFRVF